MLFLKAFSWDTNPWVKLGDFMEKNVKLEREICIQQKINKVETKYNDGYSYIAGEN